MEVKNKYEICLSHEPIEILSLPSGRIGRFSLHIDDIDIKALDKLIEEIMQKMKIFIFDANYNEKHKRIDYLAYCKDFDEIKTGDEIPEYVIRDNYWVNGEMLKS